MTSSFLPPKVPQAPTYPVGKGTRGFGPIPSEQADSPESEMSDSAREEAIKEAGKALEAAHVLYLASGCFHDAAARDQALRRMEDLIRGRSQAQVEKMERELGLA